LIQVIVWFSRGFCLINRYGEGGALLQGIQSRVGTLLTLVQVTTSLSVLALNASCNPEQSPRVRALLDDLVSLIQECEEDLGTYALS
jgi:hypothetical protein